MLQANHRVVAVPEPPASRAAPDLLSPPPAQRTPHHDWSVRSLRYLGGATRCEFVVDRRISIDVLLGIARREHRLGPIGDACEGALVGLELYAAPPRLGDAATTASKAFALACRPEARRGGAALVVLCRRAIGAFGRLPLTPTPHRGWWRLDLGIAVLHVVDASLLATDGAWGAVRFVTNPRPASPDEDLLAELQRDPRVSTQAVRRIAEAIMNEQLQPATKSQRRSAASIVRSQGRREGRAEGRVEGRAEGQAEGVVKGRVASLLAVAAVRGLAFTDAQRERVLSCADLQMLERWLVRAATVASADEVFA